MTRPPRCRAARASLLTAAIALPAAAQVAAPPPPAEPKDPQPLERVEITGTRPDETAQRRRSTAAKIVVGRDEIERYGDSTAGDLLKRLPGVTLQGRPGRGGAIRMRGLGSGYTQILIDGERMSPGFPIDSLSAEQIERIEILRAPTAETGARAIAGTINIVMREGFTKRLNDLRITTGYDSGSLQPSVAWTRNGGADGFAYNSSLSVFQGEQRNDGTSVTEAHDIATGVPTLAQADTGRVLDRRQGLHASGRLQWRDPAFGALTLMPLLVHNTASSARDGRLVQTAGATPPAYETAHTDGRSRYTFTRLNANWTVPLADGGRIETRAGAGLARYQSRSLRSEAGGAAPRAALDETIDTADRNLSLGAKLDLTLGEGHGVVAGVEAEANRRNDTRTGEPALADFEPDLTARTTRFAAYVQDEWKLTPQWAVHAGLRWEAITTRGSGADGLPTNRSSVWTPLFHAVWRPEPRSRDQLRISLTRSYRAPSLGNLIGRPSINTRNPPRGANTPTQFDRAGNPALRPELATGIDIAVERYPAGGGIFSANLFHRRITDLMRSLTTLETVPWADVQRWVLRPQNIGRATTQGLELEAKFRASELWPDAPALDLRANASFFRSRVDSVASPDNRLDQQPDATANLGADWRVPRTPLTIGGSLNWTPAYTTRLAAAQTAFQGRKRIIEAYALWVYGPAAQLRVTANNLDPRDSVTGSSVEAGGIRETTVNTGPSHVNLQVRLELKL